MIIICSAKEIKPNGPDITRKVKKKMDRIPPPMGRRETSPFSHSKLSPNNSSYSNAKSSNSSAQTLSMNRNFSGFSSLGNNGSNNNGNNNRPPSTCKPGIGPADIAKRPIKCVLTLDSIIFCLMECLNLLKKLTIYTLFYV